MKAVNRPQKINERRLKEVGGGLGGPAQPVQPIKPALPDMGAPKYSADWWSFVRNK